MVTAGISRNSLLTAFSTHCLNGHYCLPTDLRISVWATNIPFIVSLLPVKAESQAELLYKEHIVRNAGRTAFEFDSHLIRLLSNNWLPWVLGQNQNSNNFAGKASENIPSRDASPRSSFLLHSFTSGLCTSEKPRLQFHLWTDTEWWPSSPGSAAWHLAPNPFLLWSPLAQNKIMGAA